MAKLLIVESPTKAKKIWGILKGLYPDEEYEVEATFGHLVDLPEREISIDVDNGFACKLLVKNHQRVMKLLAKAEAADEIFLATDPDREGEAIAKHCYDIIDGRGIQVPMHRIRFNEVSKSGIKKALDEPTDIDYLMCEAQLARRTLDRLVGYKITPVLWDKLNFGMTAGRVQSYALGEVVRRERERRSFKQKMRWTVYCKAGEYKLESLPLSTKKEVLRYRRLVLTGSRTFSETDNVLKPRVPYTTSSILQDASKILAIGSKDCMSMLQKLFESGLITYHRTDSIRLSAGFISAARDFILRTVSNDKRYIPDRPRFYPGKGAHEAIRPVDPNKTPMSAKELTPKERDLYKLIWVRAVCSQAAEAKVKDQKIAIVYQKPTKLLELVKITGTRVVFDGWLRFSMGLFQPYLPTLDFEKCAPVKPEDVHSKKTPTLPPERYTEATLIKHLEDVDVGRPSTYASIVASLFRHKYIAFCGGGRLLATRRGELLVYFMEQSEQVKQILDKDFTAEMESDLDKIANGTDSVLSARIVLGKCWNWLKPALQAAQNITFEQVLLKQPNGKKFMLDVVVPRAGEPFLMAKKKKFANSTPMAGLDFAPLTNEIIIFKPYAIKGKCPKCKAEKMQVQQSKYGVFARCTACQEIDKKARF